MSPRPGAFGPGRQRALSALAEVLLPPGHGLPGGVDVDVGRLLSERVGAWDREPKAALCALVSLWDLSPIVSRRRHRFSALSLHDREAIVRAAAHSRLGLRRQALQVLKQLLYVAWASAPEVEDALGYDYRCARDGEPHGAARAVVDTRSLWKAPEEPGDYYRPGPAIESRAVPLERARARTFTPPSVDPSDLVALSWPALSDGSVHRADIAVVGSGAGGAVVAATLAEAGADVIVLEEGPQVSAAEHFAGSMFDRFERLCRDNATSLIWGRPPIPLPLGRVVGGTTVVNSGTCFRAPDRVLARWADEFGVAGATSSEMSHHYADIEAFLNVRPVPWELLGPNGMAAHKGAVALGYSGGPLLRNIADCHGCGQCAFGCPTDAKQAMHVSYLPRAQRAGARVFAQCRVDRIEVDDGRARGLQATLTDESGHPKGTLGVRADYVVVCAGAVQTPALLASSGIPDPSAQTGRNLRVHPATGVSGLFDDDWVSWKGTLQSYYIDQFFDSHELMFEATTAGPSIAAGSVSTMGAEAMADFGSLSKLATLGFYVSDTSKGRVWLPKGRALTTYRLNDLDARRMARGLCVASEVLLAAGAKRVFVGLPGMKEVSSRDDLSGIYDRVRRDHLRLTAFHPMGTVRMGSHPGRSVVDPYGRHHQVGRLVVADASVFPTCVGVNPQMTIMAFAKRTAEAIGAAA